MFHGPWLLLTVAAAAAPAAAWLLLTLAQPRKAPIGRSLAALVGLAQFGALGINAAGRQWVQHLEIRPYFDILSQPTEVQWSPLVVFLLAFVAGLGLVGWMLYQVAKVAGQPEAA
jgi:hypothetical protein